MLIVADLAAEGIVVIVGFIAGVVGTTFLVVTVAFVGWGT